MLFYKHVSYNFVKTKKFLSVVFAILRSCLSALRWQVPILFVSKSSIKGGDVNMFVSVSLCPDRNTLSAQNASTNFLLSEDPQWTNDVTSWKVTHGLLLGFCAFQLCISYCLKVIEDFRSAVLWWIRFLVVGMLSEGEAVTLFNSLAPDLYSTVIGTGYQSVVSNYSEVMWSCWFDRSSAVGTGLNYCEQYIDKLDTLSKVCYF